MKKYLLVCFLMLLILTVFLHTSLITQEKTNEEESKWNQLEEMQLLKTLEITEIQRGEVWQVDLKNIKLALERAKIYQKIAFLFHAPASICITYDLGAYSPSGLNSWANIPSAVKIYKNKGKLFKEFGFSMEKNIDLSNKAALLFVDSTGLVKAVVMVAIPVTGW